MDWWSLAPFSNVDSGLSEDRPSDAVADHHVLGVGNLIGGDAADLAHGFEVVVDTVDVGLTEQAAVGVERDLAAQFDVAVANEVLGFARSTEAELLEGEEHQRCEVLVDHERVDVVSRQPRITE